MIWIKPQLAVAAVLLTVCGYVSVGGEYMRVCYYANWAQYRPSVMRFIPSNINPTLCTHIMYAFAKILPDTNSLGTTENNDDGLGGNYKKVTDLKTTAPGLKVLLAVGGWNHTSSGFTDVVSTDTRIDAFCDNVITFLRTRNFDGLDIDWEFPGQRGGNAGDKQRYTKLVARLRQKFNAETGNQNTLILSASVSGSRNTIDSAYEVSSISTYFDFVNIMAYDYQGSWSTGLDHGSPLYPRSDQQPPDSYTNA
ncbi:chitotriosidase-1-like, partial [Gigantopelta aegis]|uniref:chitotriosidase-1-like n=1 Tax=Gigantopelta aegis TaxID=1735272 RepID=UPI001B88B9DB